MSISTADFKNGMCIEYNNKLYTIVEFQHVKPGKGSAFVRTKLRDVHSGRVIDNTFNAGAKVEPVRLESKTMQYLYNDGADFYFMDTADYNQISDISGLEDCPLLTQLDLWDNPVDEAQVKALQDIGRIVNYNPQYKPEATAS